MNGNFAKGLLIPFLGTTAGSACVFFMKGKMNETIEKLLTGFAAGVMVAASIWSLLIPAMEESKAMGRLAFLPAAVGFVLGTLFLLILDEVIPHLHRFSDTPEGRKSELARTTMMVLAVVLHNIPEGMATGIVLAGTLDAETGITMGSAIALSLGIAIQNFPEGAIISMPLHAEGESKTKAFVNGSLSGAVEPLAGLVTLLAAEHILPAMPYLLSFAAGAMMYVVVEELIPEMSRGEHSNKATIAFTFGFVLMMALDVALS